MSAEPRPTPADGAGDRLEAEDRPRRLAAALAVAWLLVTLVGPSIALGAWPPAGLVAASLGLLAYGVAPAWLLDGPDSATAEAWLTVCLLLTGGLALLGAGLSSDAGGGLHSLAVLLGGLVPVVVGIAALVNVAVIVTILGQARGALALEVARAAYCAALPGAIAGLCLALLTVGTDVVRLEQLLVPAPLAAFGGGAFAALLLALALRLRAFRAAEGA